MRYAIILKVSGKNMDWNVFAVCVFAIAASYLIISMPFSSAAQVTVSYGGSSQTTSYSPETYVSKHVSVNATGDIRIQVSNGSANAVDSVHVYRCRARSPSECSAQVTPDSFNGNVDVAYAWSEASDASGQTANIMLVVHATDAKGGRWLSFWSHGANPPGNPYSMVDSSIGSILVAAKDINYVPIIMSFIEIRGMLPMNPLWTSSIVFTGAAGFHDIMSSAPPAADTQAYYAGNSKGNITSGYAFVFPYNGAFTLNGVTVASSPDYITGDGVCSANERPDLLGCIDCGTDAGYYCDTARGAKQLGSISLSTQTGPVKVSNCNVANTVSLSFTMANMPTGAVLTAAQYSLNGSGSSPSTCTSAGGNVFACDITTPAVQGCRGADYMLSPNSMALTIRFNNASSYITRSVTAAVPAITVGSWTCGQHGCETGLGESRSNCCYDCGCAPGQYCDFAPGQPETSACKSPLSNANLRVASANPLNFYTHNAPAGDALAMELHITNAPQSVTASGSGCRISDCLRNGLPCTANCTVSCTKQATTNPDLYNSTCGMNFRIAGYDQLSNYSVYPVITSTMSYANGTGSPIAAALEVEGPVISVGSHWKGDGKCDLDESYNSVCFDCPCPAGQYCDSASTYFSTASDRCRQASELNMTLDGIGRTAFSDSAVPHTVEIRASISGKPHGLSASGFCGFNGSVQGSSASAAGTPACSMSCTVNETAAGYGITCGLDVPVINYKASAFYDSSARKLTLPKNAFGITLSFNNGSKVSSLSQGFALPDIAIDVVPHCGDNACDAGIGEDSSFCCRDCGCPAGRFCYAGDSPNGRCLNTSDIYLAKDSVRPDPLTCTIQQLKGDCIFVSAVDVNARVINPPPGMRLMSAWFSQDGRASDANCLNTGGSNYSCSVILENINHSAAGTANISAALGFTISYVTNGTAHAQNITAGFAMPVAKEKSEYVRTCEQRIADLEKQEKSLNKDKQMITSILAAIIALETAMCIICRTPGGHWACVFCVWGICVVLCVSGILLPMLSDVTGKISQIKAQREATCNTDNPGGLGNENSMNIGGLMIGLALGIACMICLMTQGFGLTSSGDAAASEFTGPSQEFLNSVKASGGVTA